MWSIVSATACGISLCTTFMTDFKVFGIPLCYKHPDLAVEDAEYRRLANPSNSVVFFILLISPLHSMIR